MNGYINTQQTGARKIANYIRIDIERVTENKTVCKKYKKRPRGKNIVNLFHQKIASIVGWDDISLSLLPHARSVDHFNESQAKNKVPKKVRNKHLHLT